MGQTQIKYQSIESLLADQVAALRSSVEQASQATHKQSKTSVENCSFCGHSRNRHIFNHDACTCTIPLGGSNPAVVHCRCSSFNQPSPVAGELKSTVEDRRDNRDPLSEEMTRTTKQALVEIRDAREHSERKAAGEWPYDTPASCICSPGVISAECPWHN
jgi:hypothetical protein